MSYQHFKFPSIEQFRHVVRHVKKSCNFHGITVLPTIKFQGTVKLHGTNSAIVLDTTTGEMWCQSRERILSLTSDNAGFCQWVESNKQQLKEYLSNITNDYRYLVVYGEWCGGNIQAGVAINGLPKMFVAFKIRYINDDHEYWTGCSNFGLVNTVENMWIIENFPTYTVEVDFNNPEEAQNKFVKITEAVEAECPVGKYFGKIGIGEGIVWCAIETNMPNFNIDGLMFKVKGEKHSSSKVRTLASIDVEQINKMNELVDYLVSDNRLTQGLDVLKAREVDIDDSKNTRLFIDWIKEDVIKEETDTILASGLDFSKVINKVMSKARQFYNNR